jgi:hypothetical protein
LAEGVAVGGLEAFILVIVAKSIDLYTQQILGFNGGDLVKRMIA